MWPTYVSLAPTGRYIWYPRVSTFSALPDGLCTRQKVTYPEAGITHVYTYYIYMDDTRFRVWRMICDICYVTDLRVSRPDGAVHMVSAGEHASCVTRRFSVVSTFLALPDGSASEPFSALPDGSASEHV